ncbi:MAG: glycosyltransferase [Rhizobacter sp.]
MRPNLVSPHIRVRHRPLLSVLIPAYNALAHLPRAVQSCLHAAAGGFDLQIVVAPDDACDYRGLLTDTFGACDRICVLEGDWHRTGPGAARNRALAHAAGDFVFALDADDEVREFFFVQAMAHALGKGVCNAGMDYIHEDGQSLRSVYAGESVKAEELIGEFASSKCLIRADLCAHWAEGYAEDVAHDLAAVVATGGVCPNVPGGYAVHLNGGSMCTQAEAVVQEGYDRLLRSVLADPTTFGFHEANALQALRRLVCTRLAMSESFERTVRRRTAASYHQFVEKVVSSQGSDSLGNALH